MNSPYQELRVATARFVVALWDATPLGWVADRLGLELRGDIRARAALPLNGEDRSE